MKEVFFKQAMCHEKLFAPKKTPPGGVALVLC
jgi:hypothetical protein